MENSLEKINREMGAEIRGKYGTKRGNEIIRSMAEAMNGLKYRNLEVTINDVYKTTTEEI